MVRVIDVQHQVEVFTFNLSDDLTILVGPIYSTFYGLTVGPKIYISRSDLTRVKESAMFYFLALLL